MSGWAGHAPSGPEGGAEPGAELGTARRGVAWDVALGLAREQLALGRPVRVRVRGGSMWPALRDGQVVLVGPATFQTLRVGDVVLYRRGETLVLHRVVRRAGGVVWVQGDARPCPDGPLAPGALVGRVPRRLGDGLRGRLVPWRGRAWRAMRLGKRLFFDGIWRRP